MWKFFLGLHFYSFISIFVIFWLCFFLAAAQHVASRKESPVWYSFLKIHLRSELVLSHGKRTVLLKRRGPRIQIPYTACQCELPSYRPAFISTCHAYVWCPWSRRLQRIFFSFEASWSILKLSMKRYVCVAVPGCAPCRWGCLPTYDQLPWTLLSSTGG